MSTLMKTSAALVIGLASSSALATTEYKVDLDSLAHGEIVNGNNLPPIIGGQNFHNDQNYIVAFDTTETGTRDPDLEGPRDNGGGSWAKGNLKASNHIVGTVLIIQEYDDKFGGYTDADEDTVSRPDDEGRRSKGSQPGAGEITLDFDTAVITSFRMTLVDIEGTAEFQNGTGFFMTVSDFSGSVTIPFKDFITPGSDFHDSSIVFGNNSANQIQPITAEKLNLNGINKIEINLGGSGAIGEIYYTLPGSGGGGGGEIVPTPGAAGAALIMLGGIAVRRRRKG